jgi:hypothetical protein
VPQKGRRLEDSYKKEGDCRADTKKKGLASLLRKGSRNNMKYNNIFRINTK